jgi:hypothetical protein
MTWVTKYPDTEPLVTIPAGAHDRYHKLAGSFEALPTAEVPAETAWLSIQADRLAGLRLTERDMRTIRHLQIESRSLRALELPMAPALESLELRCGLLEALPASVVWPRLRSLYIKGARLTALPATLGGASLKKVYLGACHLLAQLPDEPDPWLTVRDLNLSGCALSTLPTWFERLDALTHCSLSENRLSDPAALGPLWGCRSLQGLALRMNNLPSLPEEIGLLTALKDLSVDINPIGEIPDSLARCADLEVLLLAHTGLSTIPTALAQMAKLKFVDVTGTRITVAQAKAWREQHGRRTRFVTSDT